MYQLFTKKQKSYFHDVIRLHYEEGLTGEKIAEILPIGHSTASKWISIFAEANKYSVWENKGLSLKAASCGTGFFQ